MRRAVATLVLLWLAGCGNNPTANDAQPTRLRILTYNIHIGIGNDKKLDLPRIAAVIARCRPDIVALQELDVGTSRTGRVDEPAELSRLTGFQVHFGKTLDHQGGQYGIAILSRYPIREPAVHPLPCTPGREPRVALAARITPANGPPLRFICTHLDATDDEHDSLPGARRLNELFGAGNEPAILAGDFNKTPDSATIHTLLACWNNAAHSNPQPTIPSQNPTRQIDFVFYRPAGAWRVIEAKAVEESMASDHRPVLAEFERIVAGR